MIENTFCHVPGIGATTEQKLWGAGILSWRDFPGAGNPPVARRKADTLRQHLERSTERLAARDAAYFARSLRADQQWRLFSEFQDSVAYLDIETTGLGNPGDHITTIALYDGLTVRHYVHGQNLADFPGDIAAYSLLVTFNGKTFDVPFIQNYFRVELDQAHIDLRYVLASLGFRGGLKACEKKLGLDRGELEGVDGFLAVLLWRKYRRTGDRRYLDTLLSYNIQDVLNLEVLMALSFNLRLRATPFEATHRLPVPTPVRNPFEADPEIIRSVVGG